MHLAANSNLRVTQATPAVFEAEDLSDSQFGINASLLNGILRFTVLARSAGQTASVSGREFFDAMIANFLPNIHVIEGHWVAGIDLDTNIQQFNYWTGPSGNLSDIEAAKKTWTGVRAASYGFTNVKIVFKNQPHAPGNYVEVLAHFSR